MSLKKKFTLLQIQIIGSKQQLKCAVKVKAYVNDVVEPVLVIDRLVAVKSK